MESDTISFLAVVLILLAVMILLIMYSFWNAYQEKRKIFRPLQRQNAMRPRRSADRYFSDTISARSLIDHYISSVSVMSLWQSDDSIRNAPPSYEDVDEPPPHYEEVMRIHNPMYQNQQPTVPPIAESLSLSASQQPTNPQISDIETSNSVSRAHAESRNNHLCTLEKVYTN